MQITDDNPSVDGFGYGGEFYFYGDKAVASSILYMGGIAASRQVRSADQMRSPIYYDYNDTGYYLDPNSTTNIRYLKVNTTGTASSTRALTIKQDGYGEYNYGSYPGAWTSALQIQNNDNTKMIWISPLDSGNHARFHVNGTNSGLIFNVQGSINASGTNALEIYSSYVYTPLTWYAAFWYDSNDTGYYVNPNGTSRIGGIQIGGASTSSNEIRFYGVAGDNPGSYNHGAIIERLWRNGDESELLIFKGNDPDTSTIHDRVRIAATGRIVFDSTAGYGNVDDYISAAGTGNIEGDGYFYGSEFHVPGSIFSPIFYDRNNSAYFADPAGRSRLSSIDYGNGGYYFAGGDWGWRHNTPSGWIQFGPANTGHAHIYTDRSNFYFNVYDLYANGYRVALYNYWYGNMYLGSGGDFYATIFYDTNNTGYYCDPASTNRLNFVNANNIYINPGYMLYSDPGGWTGEYYKIQWHSSHLYLQAYANGYHIMRYGSDGLESHQFARDGNYWNRYMGWMSNYINQNVRTDAGPTFQEVYTNGWFRNNNSGQGLYNQNRGMHWYSNNGYWKSAGGGYGYGGIVMYNNYESDLRGYAGYWDGSGFGMLNSSGNWQIRIEYGNAHMELYRVTWANDMRAYIFYDRDDTGYYIDANGTSQWVGLTDRGRGNIGLTGKSDYRRPQSYTGDRNYWTGTQGWGTTDFNWMMDWGSGFNDSWGNPGNQPPGTSHWETVQAFHYSWTYGGGYGWQMTGGPVDRLWFRNIWSSPSGWKAMVDSNNRGEYCIPTYDYNHYSRVYFTYNRGYYATQTDSAMLQPYSTGNNGAFMSFHKGGYYALNLGLDGDNVVRWGGWSSRWQRYYLNDDTIGTPYVVRANFDNYGGGGMWVSDDGDLADVNDGYLSLRASYGLRIFSGNRGGGANINLRYDGVIIASNNIIAYGSPSDRRLKDNVKYYENALEKVLKLRGVEFDWKEGTDEYETTNLRHDIGFIAQEVEDVEPMLVRPDDAGYLAIRDRAMPALLVNAMKELKAELDEAKAEIKMLKEKLGLG